MENSKGVPRTASTRMAFCCSSSTSAWAKSHWMAKFFSSASPLSCMSLTGLMIPVRVKKRDDLVPE
jgi:hypothetical protein